MNGVIDSDGHVFEIDESWDTYADPVYRDRWPRLITDSKGRQIYLFEGRYSHTGREVGPPEGTSAAKVRDGASNPRARLDDMDIQGIDIAALFPGFSLRACGWIEDPDLACAIARAYNNWLCNYCNTAARRLKGLAVLPLRDIAESVRELKRAVDTLGFIGVAFPPGALNKAVSDEYFYPVFQAAEELHVPIMFHAGSLRIPGVERFNYQYLPTHTLSHPYEQMVALMCTMYGGLLEEFPRLNFAYVEAGCGWLPFWIERITEHYERRAREVPKMKQSPQDYLRSGRIFVTCEADESTLECVVRLCGDDVVLYASDYPHWDSRFDAVQEIRKREGLSDAAKTKILRENAKRLFGSVLEFQKN